MSDLEVTSAWMGMILPFWPWCFAAASRTSRRFPRMYTLAPFTTSLCQTRINGKYVLVIIKPIPVPPYC